MRDKALVLCLLLSALMLISVLPVMAFVYPDGTEDAGFELFGPRIDKYLIKMYNGEEPEFIALRGGEIDITDWPLTKAYKEEFTADPTTYGVLDFKGEAGLYLVNFNVNPNQYLGNPPKPIYANPVYPNPTAVPQIRQAMSYLIDRPALCTLEGEGLFTPIFTPIPAYMTAWIDGDIKYGGALAPLAYPPSLSKASTVLTQGGFLNTSEGSPVSPRYWDRNANGKKDAGEDFQIKIYSRADKLRKGAIDRLVTGLSNPLIDVPYLRTQVTGGEAWQICMVDKNYHIYTSGWINMGPDPDFVYDSYNWVNYYHPEDPQNFGGVNDPILNSESEMVKYAPDTTIALNHTIWFQRRFAEMAIEIPLGSTASPKAWRKVYTGGNNAVLKTPDDGENKYRNQDWTHLCNEKGLGVNAEFTTRNAYVEGYYFGDGQMTMRQGWKEPDHPKTLNPLYSSWYWEFEIIDRCYDYLGERNPITLGPYEVPFLAKDWQVGTWIDPADSKEKSKVTLTIRPDVFWQDGKPLTIEDVYFTLVELPKLLDSVGAPATWWDPAVRQMKSFFIIDPYTVEILLKVKSVWAVGWVVGTIIVPKHIWKPLAEAGPDVVTKDEADPLLMGSGHMKFVSVDHTGRTALLVRNPTYHRTVDKLTEIFFKNVDYTGATPPTTPYMYKPYMFKPSASVKYPMGDPKGTVNVTVQVNVTNLGWNFEEDINKTVELIHPNGTTVVLASLSNVVIAAQATYPETFVLSNLGPGNYTIRVTVTTASGEFYDWIHAHLAAGLWPLFLGPKVVSRSFWITVPEDAAGAGTPGIPEPDFKIDMLDLYYIAKAFGSLPGHERWNSVCDVDHNFKVDMLDLYNVAKQFGWQK